MSAVSTAMTKMNFLSLVLSLLCFMLTGCDKEEDMNAMDPELLAGSWEVVVQGDQNVFKRQDFLDITVSRNSTNGAYDNYQGDITTYFLTATDNKIYDKSYLWYIRGVDNHQLLLDLVLQGEEDSDDLLDGNYFYRIIKLTDTHMWWQVNSNGDDSVIKFRRRSDLQAE